MDCDVEFLKKRQDVSFSEVQIWLKNRRNFQVQKCCCGVNFLQEIAFNHLVRANQVLITKI